MNISNAYSYQQSTSTTYAIFEVATDSVDIVFIMCRIDWVNITGAFLKSSSTAFVLINYMHIIRYSTALLE